LSEHHSKKETELEFRIRFKEEYGIDYQVALDDLKQKQDKRNRWWHSLSVLYRWNS